MKSHMRVRGAARIARQPSKLRRRKLKVLGSNPSGPATHGAHLYCKHPFPLFFFWKKRRLIEIKQNIDFTIGPFRPRKRGPRRDKGKHHNYPETRKKWRYLNLSNKFYLMGLLKALSGRNEGERRMTIVGTIATALLFRSESFSAPFISRLVHDC
jgi:hypothetical protein